MTLYFIRALKTGLCKVGVSDSFDARLSKLRREGPDELEVLRVFHGDSDYIEALEKEIHSELKPYHSHGEWFEHCPEIIAQILERLDAQFNGSELDSVLPAAPDFQIREIN